MGKSYTVRGQTYQLLDSGVGYEARGTASWYGPGFHGRLTANGEIYDQRDKTAAHKSLPFDSVVEVTNMHNGRTVELRINDRGPFVGRRLIDVSEAAAEELGFREQGTATVIVRYLRKISRA